MAVGKALANPDRMMRKTLCLASLSLLLLGASGCHLYFGDDDDDCSDYEAYPWPGNRNPSSGQCEGGGGGGGGGCYDILPAEADSEGAALYDPYYQDWAMCESGCEWLGEAECRAADACRAIYMPTRCEGADCVTNEVFVACWGTAPSGAIQGGGCVGLDAYECSRHNDCIAVHEVAPDDGIGWFSYCGDEVVVCDDGDVDAPYELRDPESGKCQSNWDPCLPGGGEPGVPIAIPDWGACTSYCTGLDETSCKAADGCRAIYANACPPWADCFSLQYTECWATAPSGPVRGGGCVGLDSYECSRHDDCVAEHDSDWSGCDGMGTEPCPWTVGGFLACNDEAVDPPPPPPPPACPEIADEATCIEAACAPLYEGSECTCDPSGCTCAVWTFVACTDA